MRSARAGNWAGGGMAEPAKALRRAPLNRDRVLRAAVAIADDAGIEALSMRNLAQELGVVPMALYKHVANKEELLDGMVDVIAGEIDPPICGTDWKDAIRRRILSARQALLRRPRSAKLAARYPHIIEIATAASHDEKSAVGRVCGDQFEFALDVLLDGFERLHQQGWTSTDSRRGTRTAG